MNLGPTRVRSLAEVGVRQGGAWTEGHHHFSKLRPEGQLIVANQMVECAAPETKLLPPVSAAGGGGKVAAMVVVRERVRGERRPSRSQVVL